MVSLKRFAVLSLLKVDSNGPNDRRYLKLTAGTQVVICAVVLSRKVLGIMGSGSPWLDGEQEARLIAMRLGSPPAGYANWSLRLLAERFVTLGEVSSIHETCRSILKKTV